MKKTIFTILLSILCSNISYAVEVATCKQMVHNALNSANLLVKDGYNLGTGLKLYYDEYNSGNMPEEDYNIHKYALVLVFHAPYIEQALAGTETINQNVLFSQIEHLAEICEIGRK